MFIVAFEREEAAQESFSFLFLFLVFNFLTNCQGSHTKFFCFLFFFSFAGQVCYFNSNNNNNSKRNQRRINNNNNNTKLVYLGFWYKLNETFFECLNTTLHTNVQKYYNFVVCGRLYTTKSVCAYSDLSW